jgi:CPA2 family monovalent cation:H+ antiporter-2
VLAVFIHVLNKIKSFRFPASEYLLKNFDIGTLGVLGICFASAALSGLLGLSPALGAFLGGLAVGHSTLRRGALTMAQPVQSILLFVFFLSVGLLIDLDYLLQQIWVIGVALAVVTCGRTLLTLILLMLAGEKFEDAFSSALILSPVGEFSFIIASAGLSVGALSAEGYKLAIAVIALSLLVSPLFFLGARVAHRKATTGYFRRAPEVAAPSLPGPG